MGMFGFNKKDKDTEEEVKDDASSTVVKKNKKSGLSTVIRPSVIESALSIMEKNEPFISEDNDGEKAYVCLSLPTERIGGLSKKTKKDEAKGLLVELMNGGSIDIYALEDSIENDELIFIPTATTIEQMSDFSMLTNVEYDLVFVNEDGAIERTDFKVTFDEIKEIFDDEDGHIDDIIGDDSPEEEDVPLQASDVNLTEVEAQPEVQDDGVSLENMNQVNESAPAEQGSIVPPVVSEQYQAPEVPAEQFDDQSDYQEDDAQQEEEDVVEVYEDEDVNDTYDRVVAMDDLVLGYGPKNFNVQFHEFVPDNVPLFNLPLDDSGNWLVEQVSTIVTEANQDLQALREHHRQQLYNEYVETMNRALDHILRTYDYANPESEMFDSRKNIEESLEKSRIEMEKNIEALIKEQDDKYMKDRQARADLAREEALRAYDDRHKKQNDEYKYRIRQDEQNNMANLRIQRLHELNQYRREKAILAQAKIESGILLRLTQSYDEMLKAEQARRKDWQKRITTFVDSNRQYDIERTHIIEQQLKEDSRVRKLEEEQQLRINQMKLDFEAQGAATEARIKELTAHHQAQLADKDEQSSKISEAAAIREAQLKDEISRLERKFSDLEQVKQELYDAQATRLTAERDSWKNQLESNQQQVKRTQTIIIALCVVTALAALFVGILFGTKFGHSIATSNISNTILTSFIDATHVDPSSFRLLW